MPLMTKKLLALAAPAAILLASPAAFAGGATAAPTVAPVSAPAPHAEHSAAAFAAFAAFLRTAAAAATTVASRPMMADDDCPLAGNVGKSSHADRCAMRTAIAKAGDAK